MILTEFAVNLYETGIFTTWQAGQTRKGFRICACLLGIPNPFFTLRVATRFCETLDYLGCYPSEKQKMPEPDTDKIGI